MSGIDLGSMPSDIKLPGQVYLVTGAANGIGRALALQLGELGATVILLDKEDTELNRLYDQIYESEKGEPVIVHQDLTLLTQGHCDALLSQVQRSCGRLDGVVHCAAETGHLSPIEHYSDEDWSTVIRANLHSPYLLTRTLLPLLNSGQHSTVIFSASDQAIKSTAFWGAFAVAQQGLKALVETWADESGNGSTRIMLLDPGKVKTRFLTRLYPGINPNQFPDCNAAARAYLYLLSRQPPDSHGRFFQLHNNKLECYS